MYNQPSGLDEDRWEGGLKHHPSLAPRHTKHISILCFLLLVLMILGVYLFSYINNPGPAPGQDEVSPGRAIGQ